ncbi:MAG: hypothetical protein IT289_01555, partial [Oligoflexia bacterium]|nr:hypothetical protein [Oligoflexia bacterium]
SDFNKSLETAMLIRECYVNYPLSLAYQGSNNKFRHNLWMDQKAAACNAQFVGRDLVKEKQKLPAGAKFSANQERAIKAIEGLYEWGSCAGAIPFVLSNKVKEACLIASSKGRATISIETRAGSALKVHCEKTAYGLEVSLGTFSQTAKAIMAPPITFDELGVISKIGNVPYSVCAQLRNKIKSMNRKNTYCDLTTALEGKRSDTGIASGLADLNEIFTCVAYDVFGDRDSADDTYKEIRKALGLQGGFGTVVYDSPNGCQRASQRAIEGYERNLWPSSSPAGRVY